MVLQRVRLQTRAITDEQSFHRVFAETMGFPAFYGHNMNAWIDCMSYLDDAGAGMSRFSVTPGELFQLEVADTEDFQRRVPQVFQAFVECAAFVNRRRTDAGEPSVLSLVFL
jgi:hypothetical protein